MPKTTFFNLPFQKKQRIIDASYDMFINNEYENVSIRGITKKSGISVGSFYQYFYDKDDLYLFLFYNIEKKYNDKIKEIAGSVLLGNKVVPMEEVCTQKEIDFDRTWYKVPLEVMRKFYFGEYNKELNINLLNELIEYKNMGKLRDCVDLQFIFYIYVSSMFNILIYFRDHNINDEDERLKIKKNFYLDIFLNGLLKSE